MTSKKELEIFLSEFEKMPKQDYSLQQYPTPSGIASRLLWYAFMNGDICGMAVADFGTGTGILAKGAEFLGAEKVYAIDIDKGILPKNSQNSMIKFIHLDFAEFNEKVDTVIMNPPFGKKPNHEDRFFLKKAFELSKRIYSIHTANSTEFLSMFSEKNGFSCKVLEEFDFPIKRAFGWHSKQVKKFRAAMLYFYPQTLKK